MLSRDNYNMQFFRIFILSFCIIFGVFMLSGLFFAKESIEKPFLLIEFVCRSICIAGLSFITKIKYFHELTLY